jgi:uncharacterized protein YecT (DUF1311 family)
MTAKRAKMGRPAIAQKLKIDQRAPIMFRESEIALIKKKAEEDGMTVSAWGRKVMVEAAGGSID